MAAEYPFRNQDARPPAAMQRAGRRYLSEVGMTWETLRLVALRKVATRMFMVRYSVALAETEARGLWGDR